MVLVLRSASLPTQTQVSSVSEPGQTSPSPSIPPSTPSTSLSSLSGSLLTGLPASSLPRNPLTSRSAEQPCKRQLCSRPPLSRTSHDAHCPQDKAQVCCLGIKALCDLAPWTPSQTNLPTPASSRKEIRLHLQSLFPLLRDPSLCLCRGNVSGLPLKAQVTRHLL